MTANNSDAPQEAWWLPLQSPEDNRIRGLLRKRVPEIRVNQIGFENALNFLGDLLRVNINSNWGAMEQLGITRATEVTLCLRDVTSQAVLRELLAKAAGREDLLDYAIRDGVIKVSTTDDLATFKYILVHDVRDLLPPLTEPGGEESRREKVDAFLVMVWVAVSPDSWAPVGDATVTETGGKLVVKQTESAHRSLAGLLMQLRYSRVFSTGAESIFASFKTEVDALIAQHCGDVISKIGSVYRRLSEGDSEAISQAQSTCRRIIRAFADSLYPPREEPVEVEGEQLSVGPAQDRNRLRAYVAQRCHSKSRRKKLRQTLANLYERLSGAVHGDSDAVTLDEARALFLETYLFLGEVLSLGRHAVDPGPPA